MSRILILSIVVTLWFSSFSQAQRQRRGGGPEDFVKRLDTNQNGKLEPDEMSGNAANFIKKLGFDTDKPVMLDALLKKVHKRNGGSNRQEGQEKAAKANPVNLKVPSFGPLEGRDPVPGFGGSDADAPAYDDEILDQIEDALDQYDRNGNGILEANEIRRGRWGNPGPEASDANGDGKLTRAELANRYLVRRKREDEEDSRRRDRGSRRGDRSNRGDDRRSRNSERRSRDSSSRSEPSGSRKSSSSDSGNKFDNYAKQLIENYDADKDGRLSKDEVKKMKRPPAGADQNGDGFITKTELVSSLSGGQSGNSKSKNSEQETSSGSDRSSRISDSSISNSKGRVQASGSFSKLDTNLDNQIQMHEYASDWDSETIAEFDSKDKNGDGVITRREWSQHE